VLGGAVADELRDRRGLDRDRHERVAARRELGRR
jgi:hypothetical protein